MAGSVNKVILVGNLGKDPEVRRMTSGDPVVNLSIATSETWRDKASGEKKEKTEWHRVVIFNKNLAEVAEKYLKKGAKVYVEGQLQTRKWTDKDGAEKYSTEVVLQGFNSQLTMLDGRSGGSGERVSDYSGGNDFGQFQSRAAGRVFFEFVMPLDDFDVRIGQELGRLLDQRHENVHRTADVRRCQQRNRFREFAQSFLVLRLEAGRADDDRLRGPDGSVQRLASVGPGAAVDRGRAAPAGPRRPAAPRT